MPNIVKALQRSAEGHLQEVPLGQPTVHTSTWASPLLVDASEYDVLRITLQADLTLNIANTGMDGQKLLIELTQDGTGGHLVTLGTGFSWGQDIRAYEASPEPGKTDVIGLVRHQPTSTWRVIAVAKGY